MKLFKSFWSNIVIILGIVVLLVPGIRKPVAIFVNKTFSFSPSVTKEESRDKLSSYTWILENGSKERVSLADFKNKVLVINFWATWCPPCIAEMSSYQKLYDKYQNEVVFLFVSNEANETVQEFFDQKNLDLPSYRPLTEPPVPLNGNSLPTSFLIDKSGNIVIEKVGSAKWDSESVQQTIDKLLAE